MNLNGKPQVMVVDDDLSMCNFLRTFLTERGYQAVTLGSAVVSRGLEDHASFSTQAARATTEVAIAYTRLDGIPLGRYWRPLFAWYGDLDLVPHLWQMVCLGETEAVVTFFPPVDIDQLGDRKKLADYCFKQVSGAVQAANSGRYELLPPPKKAA